jgi:ubiquinone/menaquinone biosynthesis C-methylase UbiE
VEKTDPQLEFSEKYDEAQAKRYFAKHQTGLRRKLTTGREISIARKALMIAGNPASVLDIPSGTGRFWEVLAEKPDRTIYAADYSQAMLDVALQQRSAAITSRIEAFQCSAFDIPRPDGFVENIFCMRLLHHIGEPKDRLAMLREFNRVTTDSVCLSLWVDGNYQSGRRLKMEQRRKHKKYQNRFVIPRQQIEQEFVQAGFEVIDHLDFMKYISMWRVYILRKRSR